MKSAIRISVFTLLFTALAVFAQNKPASATTHELTPKSSPASDSLIQMAKDQTADQKAMNDHFQQAKSSLDNNQKALNDELGKEQKDLDAKIAADKKYKNQVEHIESLKKQITELGQKAQADFLKQIGPLQQKLQSESAGMQSVIPIVRRENGWPDTVTFDPATGKWTDTAKK